ncbi:hypothetical protein AOPFMNJM_1680 [Methylobacterium jeotgali]|uniref:ROK family protein n=2 Tax=Pseudomonadota TaxID=1224 RepID=A0ABQ4SV50_9HYPH|nr:hypothetical protein [Methylobacterium jeotgali]GJE06364.1 hypothetical protein AOPFMNJM_1680 [Methylobacterium jeotgali]
MNEETRHTKVIIGLGGCKLEIDLDTGGGRFISSRGYDYVPADDGGSDISQPLSPEGLRHLRNSLDQFLPCTLATKGR